MGTPAWESDLGKSPDRVIAEGAGISQETVRSRRKELGIPAFRQPPPGRALLEPVPEDPTPVRASGSVVLRRRQGETARTERREPVRAPAEVGAPVPSAPAPRVPRRAPRAPLSLPLRRRSKMDPYLALIGVRPDSEVARLAGVTPDNVRNFRKRQGIPPAPSAALDTASDVDTAPATSLDTRSTRRKPGRRTPIDAFSHLLGTVPDAEVARQSGASVAAVSQYRNRRKIAPYKAAASEASSTVPAPEPTLQVETDEARPSVPPARRKPGRPSPIDAFADLVGTMPDRELAERSGASVEAVRLYRTYRKIPRFQAPGGKATTRVEESAPPAVAPVEPEVVPEPEPVAASAQPTPPPSASAFKVIATSRTERRKFLVVADDIVDATIIATRALSGREGGPWQIRKVRLFGEGLR